MKLFSFKYEVKELDQQNLINEEIQANEVTLIADDGQLIGVLGLDDAQNRADERGEDLIQVSDGEQPACKIMEYGKFQYEQKKRAKKAGHQPVTKEMKFRPNTEEHDYQVKVQKILKFLSKGDRVKISISFRGREASHEELGWNIAHRIVEDTGAKVIQEPFMEGNTINMMLE